MAATRQYGPSLTPSVFGRTNWTKAPTEDSDSAYVQFGSTLERTVITSRFYCVQALIILGGVDKKSRFLFVQMVLGVGKTLFEIQPWQV